MNATMLAEQHPHDLRRGASGIVVRDGSIACVDHREMELAAVMCRVVLGTTL